MTEKQMPCPCTGIAQDESCPVGHPSLLCQVCNGIGHVPAVKLDGSELWEIVFGVANDAAHEITDEQYQQIADAINHVFIDPVPQSNMSDITSINISSLSDDQINAIRESMAKSQQGHLVVGQLPTPSHPIIIAADGWFIWEGGDCPYAPEARVDVVLDDGRILLNQLAGKKFWEGGKQVGQQIIVHRPAQPALETSKSPSSNVEEIAKAIWADFVVQQACGLPLWEHGGAHEFQMQFRSFARAALAAMAPPQTREGT